VVDGSVHEGDTVRIDIADGEVVAMVDAPVAV
jgi:ATP-dependent Clp protease ATP-binding subunit ClpC